MRTQNQNSTRFVAILAVVVVAILSRLIFHPFNATAMGAATLFAGAMLGLGWAAFLVPLAAVFASDLILNNFISPYSADFTWGYPGVGYTYAAYLTMVVLGATLLHKPNLVRVAGVAVSSSLVFFLISNFGVWASADQYPVAMYPPTWEGLVACYSAAVPFYRNTLIGDLFFAEAFFGLWALAQTRVPALRTV